MTAMSTDSAPVATEGPDLLTRLSRAVQWIRAQQGWRRELLLAFAWVLAGLILLPPLIWMAGRFSLGDYANGGPFALWADLLRELVRGSLAAWLVVLGPCALWIAARALLALVRATR